MVFQLQLQLQLLNLFLLQLQLQLTVGYFSVILSFQLQLQLIEITLVSMAARQGVDILMALVHAELTWQFSNPCQSSNYRLIDFKFVVGDYVPGYSNPAKFRLRRKTGGGSRWW